MPVDSRFIRKTLMLDEKVEAVGVFSPFYTASAYLWFFACVTLGFVLHFLAVRYMPQSDLPPIPRPDDLLPAQVRYMHQNDLLPIWFMTTIGLAVFFSLMLKRWTTEIFLTNHRLIHKRGLFLINVDEVDVEQLASDQVHQSLMGRVFGYGALHIRCVEADDLWLPNITHPYSFRNAIVRVKKGYREEYMNTGRLYRHGSRPHSSSSS